MALYSQTCINVGYAQGLDISYQTFDKLEEIYAIYHYKTASYTTVFPLVMAAILSHQPDRAMTSIKELGITLGTLFQIYDDILGVFGQSRHTGKSCTSDIYQGKKTILIYKALENASPTQRAELCAIYGNVHADTEEIQKVREMILTTGSLKYAQDIIGQLSHTSNNLLKQLSLTGIGKKFLASIINYFAHAANDIEPLAKKMIKK